MAIAWSYLNLVTIEAVLLKSRLVTIMIFGLLQILGNSLLGLGN